MTLTRRWLPATCAAAAALAGISAHAQNPDVGTFFNLSNDPNSLNLMIMDSIAGPAAKPSILILQVFRAQPDSRLLKRWSMDCPARKIRAAELRPSANGSNMIASPAAWHPVSSNGTDRVIFELTCKGRGNLPAPRVYHTSLQGLLRAFFERQPLPGQ